MSVRTTGESERTRQKPPFDQSAMICQAWVMPQMGVFLLGCLFWLDRTCEKISAVQLFLKTLARDASGEIFLHDHEK